MVQSMPKNVMDGVFVTQLIGLKSVLVSVWWGRVTLMLIVGWGMWGSFCGRFMDGYVCG